MVQGVVHVMQSFSFENLLLPVQLKDVMEQCFIYFWDGHTTSSPSEGSLKNKYKNSQDLTSHEFVGLVYLTRDQKCELLFICLQC